MSGRCRESGGPVGILNDPVPKKLHHGAAFYPELWPDSVVTEDIAAMQRLGLTVVRMGEFAWARMEPDEGNIDVGYFVGLMDRLHAAGIGTVFCTPTPTPPVWVTDGHPERLYVDDLGQAKIHGSRQHVCTNHAEFRRLGCRIVEAIARTVGRHPGLVAWQTDNELKCHVAECCCASCRDQWHTWLAQLYGTIEALNAAWGTEIWSQRYQRFAQVPQPLRTSMTHNASLLTAYRRFSYEKVAEFQREQVEIIRAHSAAPITHNGMVHFNVDQDLLYRDLDCGGFDHYAAASNYREYLLQIDVFRTLKPGRGFWVMESSPSHSGQILEIGHPAHPAAFVEATAVAAYAHGAEGFSYWLWRQQRTGCELPHGAIVSAWGRPTMAAGAVAGVETARRVLEPWLTTSELRPAEVALTYSDRARAMWLTEPLALGNKRIGAFDYVSRLEDWHDAIRHAGFPRDLCPESAPLAGYKLLLTPFAPNLTDDFRQRALAWVAAGGIWIVGPMTHWRTAEHTVPTDAALGDLEAAAGVQTESLYCLWETGAEGEAFGLRAPLGLWATFFSTREAQAVGTVVAGRSAGEAFLTERTVGRGRLVMLGAWPEGPAGAVFLQHLIRHYAEVASVELRCEASADVVVAARRRDGADLWFAINLGANPGHVVLPRAARDCVSGTAIPPGVLALPAHGWRAVQLA